MLNKQTPNPKSKYDGTEQRMIRTTKEKWSVLTKLLFDEKVAVPLEPFDLKRFINSESGLRLLDYHNLSRLGEKDKFLILMKMLNNFGLSLIESEDDIEIIQLEKFDAEELRRLVKNYNKPVKKPIAKKSPSVNSDGLIDIGFTDPSVSTDQVQQL